MEKWGRKYACSKWTMRRKIKALVESDLRKIRNYEHSKQQNVEAPDVAAACNYEGSCDASMLDANVETDASMISELEQSINLPGELQHAEANTEIGLDVSDSIPPSCYDSRESDCSSDDGADSGSCFRDKLSAWVALYNISGNALSDLLPMLIEEGLDVPKDPRTLLGTPASTNVINKAGGLYYYFGVVDSVCQVLRCLPDSKLNEIDTLTLHVNIDGLPLFNSSTVSLWPILGIIKELPCDPLIFGVFSGTAKPDSATEFLSDFVREMKVIEEQQGFWYCGRLYHLVLDAVICDAPARAFVKCVKGHNGYNACERCIQEGVYDERRMTLPETDAKLRTDEEFRLHSRDEHHTGVSPFTELCSVGCISHFPLDYMHLVCLGVMRRTIMLWLNGPVKCRISSTDVKKISGELAIFRSRMPKEFSRRPRSLEEVRQWKATEFRQFMLYSGPVSLLHILPQPMYDNLLLLVVSMTILLSPHLCSEPANRKYAGELLRVFVKNYGALYGSENIVYNVHNLIHLSDDADKYGSLDNVSAFPFETFLNKLKKMIRRPQNPVAQIVNRIGERQRVTKVKYFEESVSSAVCKKPHVSGPVPVQKEFAVINQYKECETDGFVVSCSQGDNCFGLHDEVVIVVNIYTFQDDSCVYVAYKVFTEVEPFFQTPLDSLFVGIQKVSCLSDRVKFADVKSIKNKYVLLPVSSKHVALPLLHI